MALTRSDWHITLDASNEDAYDILAQDPVWNCFAIAGLEPPQAEYSQFVMAAQDGRTGRAVCLILRHPILGQVFLPFGVEEGVAAIMEHIVLPEHPLIQMQEHFVPLLQRYYRAETSWKSLLRMAITPSSWQPARLAPHRPVKQLDGSDLPALKKLYLQHPESAFSAPLFSQGLFFGVYEGERIIAAGGTHALAPRHGIAVLGNILTAPEARGHGYATAITEALVTELLERHFGHVVLNVFEDNGPAIRIYQRLGFQTHRRVLEGTATLVH